MTMLRCLMVLVLFATATWGVSAQEIKEHKFKPSGKLVFDEINRITFEGYDGDEVVISTEVKKNSKSERAEGLKLINGTGLEDNTGIGLSVTTADGETRVVEISARSSKRYVVMLPSTTAVTYKHSTPHGSKVLFDKVKGELEVNTVHTSIELIDVTGPMTISTVHGRIEGVFSSVNQKGAISLASSHGLIDVSMPNTTKADLQLSSSWGEIYSDMDIAIDASDSEMQNYSANNVVGTLNGGGVAFSVTATHGNIYLRKQ